MVSRRLIRYHRDCSNRKGSTKSLSEKHGGRRTGLEEDCREENSYHFNDCHRIDDVAIRAVSRSAAGALRVREASDEGYQGHLKCRRTRLGGRLYRLG